MIELQTKLQDLQSKLSKEKDAKKQTKFQIEIDEVFELIKLEEDKAKVNIPLVAKVRKSTKQKVLNAQIRGTYDSETERFTEADEVYSVSKKATITTEDESSTHYCTINMTVAKGDKQELVTLQTTFGALTFAGVRFSKDISINVSLADAFKDKRIKLLSKTLVQVGAEIPTLFTGSEVRTLDASNDTTFARGFILY